MSKTQETHRKNHNLLHASKADKMMAASSAMRGGSYRRTIMLMAAANKTYKETGRLVLGEDRDKGN